jgi:uncharacterized protein (DUF2236 family)
MARNFVPETSIVQKVWGNPDLVLLIFAGSAAEFALNRAVDWLFFTGKIPNDPIGRFFSTVQFSQEIVFADEETARNTIERINAVHAGLESDRGMAIPDWAYRDVLYMLIDYTKRSYELVYRPLSPSEHDDLYAMFRQVGDGLRIPQLPANYTQWQEDRKIHLRRDLVYSDYTALLYAQYRRHLGFWRYQVLLRLQALLVPDEVRQLLGLKRGRLFGGLVNAYGLVERLNLQLLVRRVLIEPRYWSHVEQLERAAA